MVEGTSLSKLNLISFLLIILFLSFSLFKAESSNFSEVYLHITECIDTSGYVFPASIASYKSTIQKLAVGDSFCPEPMYPGSDSIMPLFRLREILNDSEIVIGIDGRTSFFIGRFVVDVFKYEDTTVFITNNFSLLGPQMQYISTTIDIEGPPGYITPIRDEAVLSYPHCYWIRIAPDSLVNAFRTELAQSDSIDISDNNSPSDWRIIRETRDYDGHLMAEISCRYDSTLRLLNDGPWIQYSSGGIFKKKEFYRNGVLHGLSREWYNDTQLKFSGEYKDGMKVGEFLYFKKNGDTLRVVNYRDDWYNGRFAEWFEEKNVKKIEGDFIHGKKNGIWRHWDILGREIGKGEYDHGTGMATIWYPMGNPRSIEYFKNGRRDGISKLYYKSGQLHRVQEYKDGKTSGIHKEYAPDGTLDYSAVNDHGIVDRNWYKTGMPRIDQSAEKSLSWDKAGLVTFEGFYDIRKCPNCRREGLYKEYYDNGKIKLKGEFRNGKKVGTWTGYNEDGTKAYEQDYDRDDYAVLTYFHPNGQKSAQGESVKHSFVKIARWDYWDENGNHIKTERYYKGRLVMIDGQPVDTGL